MVLVAAMKLRHAAALALVGWYLMLPPDQNPALPARDITAPISEWVRVGSFDSAVACEAEQQKRVQFYIHLGLTTPEATSTYRDRTLDYENAQCIASDDPRLKGN